MVCKHRYVCRQPDMTTEYSKGLGSVEKLLIARVILAFVLIGHEYVLWYDYKTSYFNQPMGNVTIFGQDGSRAEDLTTFNSTHRLANFSNDFDNRKFTSDLIYSKLVTFVDSQVTKYMLFM